MKCEEKYIAKEKEDREIITKQIFKSYFDVIVFLSKTHTERDIEETHFAWIMVKAGSNINLIFLSMSTFYRLYLLGRWCGWCRDCCRKVHWGEMSGGLEEEEGKYRTLVAPHLRSYHLSLIPVGIQSYPEVISKCFNNSCYRFWYLSGGHLYLSFSASRDQQMCSWIIHWTQSL